MSVKKKVTAALAAAAVAGMSLVGSWPSASGVTSDAPLADATTGVGETILVVVADVVDPFAAPARLLELNASFGEMQGFYSDPTAGYEVIGALLKTSADLSEALCIDVGKVLSGECALGEVVRTIPTIETTFVDLDSLASDATAVLCRVAGASCGLDGIKRILGEDLTLDASASLIGSAFRTKRGAEGFLELARSAGVTDVVTLQVKKFAGGYVGLGQEPAPDGSGPLTGPLPGQESYQR